MLFTWDTKNLCIVFRQWHVRSTSGLVISLLLVVALAAGYEALRAASRRYENSVNKRVDSLPSKHSLFSPGYRQYTYIYLHHTISLYTKHLAFVHDPVPPIPPNFHIHTTLKVALPNQAPLFPNDVEVDLGRAHISPHSPLHQT